MSPSEVPSPGAMRDDRYLTLVLRLVVDEQGEIQYGELADAAGQAIGRFRRPGEIPDLIAVWLGGSSVGH